jgi:DNA end-binding protein Ku
MGSGDYVVLDPEEVAEAIPESDKTLSVEAFVGCGDIDDVYFDKPYYLAPSDRHAEEAFTLIRDGMKAKKVAAIAQTVLFRRVRTLLIRAYGDGLIATTLNFDYEVRSADEAFDDIPSLSIKGEMLKLAEHIIKTKKGKFDPAAFDDRYDAALAELVKAKAEGKKIEIPKQPERGQIVDLMQALRESAGVARKSTKKPAKRSRRKKAKEAPPRRKAS